MMWLRRNSKLLNSFSPEKWEVNASFTGLVSLTFSLSSTRSLNDTPPYEAKELWITLDHTHPLHSPCELLHMGLSLPETANMYCNKEIYMYHITYSIYTHKVETKKQKRNETHSKTKLTDLHYIGDNKDHNDFK